MARRTFERSAPTRASMVDMRTGKPVALAPLPILCEQIRRRREALGMEQKRLAKLLGITPNSVSNWENGRSRPDVNLLPDICGALGITLYELFALEDPTVRYSAREQRLIENYRQLSGGHRLTVHTLVETLITVQQAEACPDIRKLPFFERPLAAGIGDPTEFEDACEPVFLYASDTVSRADCVFSVSGDSMEPVYRDGDRVLVQRIPGAPRLAYGEVGAFIAGNEAYIKVYQKDGLHSLNRRYGVMHFGEEEAVYLIGRVLGLLRPEDIASESDVKRYLSVHEEI
ncbi:MAG: helix-turn-helix domain-containing protein [Clostridia bacterium]|nr:helix-turn-helix domain-containing protein [Clostridia bacterium]